jgi:serine/threonine protein kinase/tetratricopeptide (TPR) repeat protein
MSQVQAELPARIGPFEIVGMLGEGGMGVVYGAIDPATSTRVALKTVSSVELPLLASLRREVHALRRLTHPGIVRVLETGVDDRGQPWYAMELLEGATLAALRDALFHQIGDLALTYDSIPMSSDAKTVPIVKHAPRVPVSIILPAQGLRAKVAGGHLPRVLAVVRRLLATLAYIHGEGVVHRDLKPNNIFLRDGDLPVLVDFGLAHRSGGTMGREVFDVAHEVVGTPAYMAPEQIRGDFVDSRADLYAVGCLLHELLTSVPPFTGPPSIITEQHLAIPAEPPSRIVDGCPPELDALVLALLEKRPRDRIGHAADVIELLDALGAPRDATPGPRPRPYVYRPGLAGRAAALHELASAGRAAEQGNGGCILVAGASGIGKTYVAMEAAKAMRAFQIVAGTCAPVGTYQQGPGHGPGGEPLHPFARLFQVLADRCVAGGRTETDRLLGARGKILAAHDPALARLPGQTTYPDPPPLAGAAARDRLLAALAETVAALSQTQPLLILLDDLQWADEVTLRFLNQLADDWFTGKRVLVLGTYRLEETTPGIGQLLGQPYSRQVVLDRLDAATVRALVCDMLAIDSPPAAFIEFLSLHSDGNPFFVAEYLRCATAEGLLRRGNKRLSVGPTGTDSSEGVAALSLPVTMRDLVGRRLDGLSPIARTLASFGGVIGRELAFEVLCDAAHVDDEAGMEGISELIARQVLEQTDAGTLRFTHDKLCEIAYDRLPADDRRAHHATVAAAIERRFAGTPEAPRFHSILAHHYLAAQQADKALEYLDLAGQRALASAMYEEARDLHKKLLALDDARGTPDPRRRARWERRYGEISLNLGDLTACDVYSSSAMARLGRPIPTSRNGRATVIARLLAEQGLLRLGVGAASRPGVEERDDRLEVALSASVMAWRYFFVEDMAGVIQMALRAANEIETADPPIQVAAPFAWLGYGSGIARLHPIARLYFEQAYRYAAETGDTAGRHFAAIMEVAYRIGFAQWADVERIARQGLADVDAKGDPTNAELHLTGLANTQFYMGRYDESQRGFEQILVSARGRRNLQHHAWGLYGQCLAMVARGQFAEALPQLDEAKQILAQLGDAASLIICDGLRTQLFVRRGDDVLAREAADATRGRLQKSGIGMYATILGYVGAAEGYLELADRARGDRELLALAELACDDLRRFARFVPFASPAAHVFRGQLLALQGHPIRARISFARGLEAARRLRMPFEEASGLWRAARYLPGHRSKHAEATKIFERLGCAWHVTQQP